MLVESNANPRQRIPTKPRLEFHTKKLTHQVYFETKNVPIIMSAKTPKLTSRPD